MGSKSLLGLVVAGSLTALSAAANAACPASVGTPVGAATGCIEITLLPGNTASVGGTGNPVYDGIEDTLINVTNLSGSTVNSIHLTANTDIFGFDGDGISLYLAASTGPTGYEGPNTSFANYSSPFFNSGDVLFTGGLANLASAYFSLEEAVTAASFTGPIIVNPVPGPIVGAGLPGVLMALGGLLGWRRLRRIETTV